MNVRTFVGIGIGAAGVALAAAGVAQADNITPGDTVFHPAPPLLFLGYGLMGDFTDGVSNALAPGDTFAGVAGGAASLSYIPPADYDDVGVGLVLGQVNPTKGLFGDGAQFTITGLVNPNIFMIGDLTEVLNMGRDWMPDLLANDLYGSVVGHQDLLGPLVGIDYTYFSGLDKFTITPELFGNAFHNLSFSMAMDADLFGSLFGVSGLLAQATDIGDVDPGILADTAFSGF